MNTIEETINHCQQVMSLAAEYYGTSSDESIVGHYHDFLEDDVYTKEHLEDILGDTYSKERAARLMEAIVAITRVEGEKYFDYIERLSKNPLAVNVKLVDLEVNLYCRALPPTDSLKKRYLKAYKILAPLGTGEHSRFFLGQNGLSIVEIAKNGLTSSVNEYWYKHGTVRCYERNKPFGLEGKAIIGRSALDFAVIYDDLDVLGEILRFNVESDENCRYTKDELTRALSLAKDHNCSRRLMACLAAYGAEDDGSLPNPDGCPLTSPNRRKYGRFGEVAALLVEKEKEMAVNREHYVAVLLADIEFERFVEDVRTAFLETHGVTFADFVNDPDKVRAYLSREDIKWLQCNSVIPALCLLGDYHERGYTRTKLMSAICRTLVTEMGGIDTFDDLEGHTFSDINEAMEKAFGDIAPVVSGDLRSAFVDWCAAHNHICEETYDKHVRGHEAFLHAQRVYEDVRAAISGNPVEWAIETGEQFEQYGDPILTGEPHEKYHRFCYLYTQKYE